MGDKIIPPETVRVPSRDKLYDAQINILHCECPSWRSRPWLPPAK
jgi:hypothetical protein